MPNDLSIPALGPVVPPASRLFPPATPARPHPAAERVLPNPSLRLEPALGLVVIEFRNDTGAIETSYPSQRQLAAYRANELAGIPRPGPRGTAAPDGHEIAARATTPATATPHAAPAPTPTPAKPTSSHAR